MYILPFLYHCYCPHWEAIPCIYYPFYITVTAPTGRLFHVSTILSISLLLPPLGGYSMYLLPFLYLCYCSHWEAIPCIYYPFYITVTAPTGRIFHVSTTLSISLLLNQKKFRGRTKKSGNSRGCFGMKLDRIGSVSGLGC
uniref:Uncharacterized protein n=1 Tax=Leptobrachium leishanense TaxID=445787 RepID=A0A8C5WIH1_9ANUR